MEIKSITGTMTVSENAPDFIIDPELQAMVAPLTTDEATILKENIIIDGTVREPLTVWGGTIVDGHHRWAILQRNPDIPFVIQRMEFPGKWAAIEWMCSNQLGRRNVTTEQKTYLIGKLYEARKKSVGAQAKNTNAKKQCTQNGNIVFGSKRISEQINIHFQE